MSEPNIGGGCHECGGQYEHNDFCSKKAPPPAIYDLAEFERQLNEAYQTAEESDWVMETILKCLRASKREAK